MLDPLAEFNRGRWNALVQAGIAYGRPMLDLTPASAWELLEPHGLLGDVTGQAALVLAGGGGQQSAALALLGAQVTVLDLSDEQLAGDRLAAEHYGLAVRTEQGDMRDLSRFAPEAFDLVFQPYSINFIPDPLEVFAQVRRVLRPGGLYRVTFANPFTMAANESDWNGQGYPLRQMYQDGELLLEDMRWDVWQPDGSIQKVAGPREFRHTLGTFLNGLIGLGFELLGLWEEQGNPAAEPGSWEHFMAVAPPWFTLWTRLR